MNSVTLLSGMQCAPDIKQYIKQALDKHDKNELLHIVLKNNKATIDTSICNRWMTAEVNFLDIFVSSGVSGNIAITNLIIFLTYECCEDEILIWDQDLVKQQCVPVTWTTPFELHVYHKDNQKEFSHLIHQIRDLPHPTLTCRKTIDELRQSILSVIDTFATKQNSRTFNSVRNLIGHYIPLVCLNNTAHLTRLWLKTQIDWLNGTVNTITHLNPKQRNAVSTIINIYYESLNMQYNGNMINFQKFPCKSPRFQVYLWFCKVISDMNNIFNDFSEHTQPRKKHKTMHIMSTNEFFVDITENKDELTNSMDEIPPPTQMSLPVFFDVDDGYGHVWQTCNDGNEFTIIKTCKKYLNKFMIEEQKHDTWTRLNVPYLQPFHDYSAMTKSDVTSFQNKGPVLPHDCHENQDMLSGYVWPHHTPDDPLEQNTDIVAISGLDVGASECARIDESGLLSTIKNAENYNITQRCNYWYIIAHSSKNAVLSIMKNLSYINGEIKKEFIVDIQQYVLLQEISCFLNKSVPDQVWHILKSATKAGKNCGVMIRVWANINEASMITLRGSSILPSSISDAQNPGYMTFFVGSSKKIPESYQLLGRKTMHTRFAAKNIQNQLQKCAAIIGHCFFNYGTHNERYASYFNWNQRQNRFVRNCIDFEPMAKCDLYFVTHKNCMYLIRAISLWQRCINGYQSMSHKIREEWDSRIKNNKLMFHQKIRRKRRESVLLVQKLLKHLFYFSTENTCTRDNWSQIGSIADWSSYTASDRSKDLFTKLQLILDTLYSVDDSEFVVHYETSHAMSDDMYYVSLNANQYNFEDLIDSNMMNVIHDKMDKFWQMQYYFYIKLGLQNELQRTVKENKKLERLLKWSKLFGHSKSSYEATPLSGHTVSYKELLAEVIYHTASNHVVGIDRIKLWDWLLYYESHHKKSEFSHASKVSNNTEIWLGPAAGILVSPKAECWDFQKAFGRDKAHYMDILRECCNILNVLDFGISHNNITQLSKNNYYGINSQAMNAYKFEDCNKQLCKNLGTCICSHTDHIRQFNNAATGKVGKHTNNVLGIIQNNTGVRASQWTTLIPHAKGKFLTLQSMCKDTNLCCVYSVNCSYNCVLYTYYRSWYIIV